MIQTVGTLLWHTMLILSGVSLVFGAGLCAVYLCDPEGRKARSARRALKALARTFSRRPIEGAQLRGPAQLR